MNTWMAIYLGGAICAYLASWLLYTCVAYTKGQVGRSDIIVGSIVAIAAALAWPALLVFTPFMCGGVMIFGTIKNDT